MIKELQYKGYATEPSDYECPDGQLAMSLNLINEDEQLKPVFQPSELAELPNGYKVVYIHDANSYTHYIIHDTSTNKLFWIDETFITNAATKPVTSTDITTELQNNNPGHELHSFGASEIYQVNGIGNTLIVLTSEGMHYILWKSETDGYTYLGTHMPELHISFGLKGTGVWDAEFTVNLDSPEGEALNDNGFVKLSKEENINAITEAVLAKVNKFIAEHATSKGKFIYPFLVRYAYRLYDGSLTMQSAPVLMIPNSERAPQCFIRSFNTSSNKVSSTISRVGGMVCTLDYELTDRQQVIQQLDKWKDIITSVVIFISEPIWTYDQAGKINGWFYAPKRSKGFSVCKCDSEVLPAECREIYGKWWTTPLICPDYGQASGGIMGKAEYLLPMKEDCLTQIKNTANFYKIAEIKNDNLEQIRGTRKDIEIEEKDLSTLTTRERLTDDYYSHDTLIPDKSYCYNNRVNIARIKKTLFQGYRPESQFCYTNGFYYDRNDDEQYDSVGTENYSLFIYLKKNGKTYIVDAGSSVMAKTYVVSGVWVDRPPCFYFYYPDKDAYMAVIIGQTTGQSFAFILEPHTMLNGAVCFDGFKNRHSTQYDNIDITGTSNPTPPSDCIVQLYSKIYTSEVNNPFFFPVSGITTLGTGEILGISSAAKALSQGQFGQFPLYAFTTDGVWALELSSTGTYSARQPITRDVCINPESITQLDSSVLFATDRGIMLISGSQTQCITDGIFSQAPFNVLELPAIDQLHNMLGHSADACLHIQPFLAFLAGCLMVYDYVHQRIFVSNPTIENGTPKYTYAYVFSLKSKMWGMTYSKIASTINAYPEAMAMTHDNKLVSFSDTDEEVCKGLYITRPLKLEAPDVHKTISALIQRGHFQRGDVGTILYGSRDLYNWRLVWSSKDHYLRGFRGTPYKYFRIAGLATLTNGKSIFGASVNFEPRHTNQLR